MDRERAGGAPGQAGRAAEVLMLLSACSSPFCSPSPTCHLSPPSPCPVAPFGIVQTMNLSALLSPEPGKEPCPMTPMSPQGGQRSVLMRGGGRGAHTGAPLCTSLPPSFGNQAKWATCPAGWVDPEKWQGVLLPFHSISHRIKEKEHYIWPLHLPRPPPLSTSPWFPSSR